MVLITADRVTQNREHQNFLRIEWQLARLSRAKLAFDQDIGLEYCQRFFFHRRPGRIYRFGPKWLPIAIVLRYRLFPHFSPHKTPPKLFRRRKRAEGSSQTAGCAGWS